MFIDDIEANVPAAEAIGMTGVLHTEPGATAARLAACSAFRSAERGANGPAEAGPR